MKKLLNIIILAFLTGCLSIRYSTIDLTNQTFVCDKGSMVGKTIIQLEKDTFKYSERGGLFIGKGVWSLSQDKKTIYLKGSTTLKDYKNEKLAFRKYINLELKIKNKNKLTDNSQIFIKQQ